MLIVAAPVYLIIGLMLIVATPRALAFEVCLAWLMLIVAVPVDLVLG